MNGRTGLLEVLRWRRRETALFGRLNALHAAVVGLRIRSVCGAGSRPSRMLAAMPPTMRQRVEIAPEVYRLLFHETSRSPGEIREAVERFCAVENHLTGRPTIEPPARAGWSALGDGYVGATEDDESPMAAACRSISDGTVAPVLRQTVVDGRSPFHPRVFQMPANLPTEPLSSEEFRKAVSRLSVALELIESTCGPAIAMLDACLKVVALVRIPGRPQQRRSISGPHLPGMAGLTNLDSEVWDTETVADRLVHEAIHALVFKENLADGALVSSPDTKVRVVSPWSGSRLELLTFMHAAFVWFGLWHFWRRAGAGHRRAAELAERARKGFDGESPLRNIPSEGRQRLAPRALAALRLMTAEAGSPQAATDRLSVP